MKKPVSNGEMGKVKWKKWVKARAFEAWSWPGSCCWGWLHPSPVIRGQLHTPPGQVPTPPPADRWVSCPVIIPTDEGGRKDTGDGFQWGQHGERNLGGC